MSPGLSVVICTYNGAALLPETLRHLARQRVAQAINWEILVIDNASTDNTQQVAQQTWAESGSTTPFRLLTQPKQGLAHARELGLQSARYEFVLFCDDDNWLNPNYVQLAYSILSENETIGILGGCGELAFEATPPAWALGHSLYANGPQAHKSGRVKNNIVYGAGLVARKQALNKVVQTGFKPLLTDRNGKVLSAGGDYELCYTVALAGYAIWYDHRLTFKHFIPQKRISWPYFMRFMSEGAQSFDALVPYRIRVNGGCTNAHLFNLFYLKAFLGYCFKLPALYFQRHMPAASPDKKLQLELKLTALRAKLHSFKNYQTMKRNFTAILRFSQHV